MKDEKAPLAGTAYDPDYAAPSHVDTGSVKDGRVVFPPWRGPADPQDGPTPAPQPPAKRTGFAIVGLGRLSINEILPAFAECSHARIAALVSGSREKLAAVGAQYGVVEGSLYTYDRFDEIADNPDVDVIYIVLPNGMHREYVIRAARAGKHVLCEKPMATSAADAQAMVDACNNAGVTLMIAYRIHFQPHNVEARRFVADGTYGRLVGITANNVQTVNENGPQQWRHDGDLAGGGSLPDIGLYCLNTAIYLAGEGPVEVSADIYSPPGDPKYAEVEETVSFRLKFPSGIIANCFTSYGARDDKYQRLNFTAASVDMPNAYSYRGQELWVSSKVEGTDQKARIAIAPANQFAAEIDHMAQCVQSGRAPDTPGEMGVRDHVVMEAIYRSAREGKPISTRDADARPGTARQPALQG